MYKESATETPPTISIEKEVHMSRAGLRTFKRKIEQQLQQGMRETAHDYETIASLLVEDGRRLVKIELLAGGDRLLGSGGSGLRELLGVLGRAQLARERLDGIGEDLDLVDGDRLVEHVFELLLGIGDGELGLGDEWRLDLAIPLSKDR